jgi:hypothetical protein
VEGGVEKEKERVADLRRRIEEVELIEPELLPGDR